MRNSFLFYSSYYEAISELPESEQGAVYKAIVDYGIAKKEPNLKGISNAMFKLIKPTIDAALSRYDASVENGKKGGAPTGNQNAKKQPKNNLETTQEQPRNNLETSEIQPSKQAKNNLDIDMDIDIDKNIDKDIKLVNEFKNIFENYSSASAYMRVSEKTQKQRKPYLEHFKEYFDWCFSDKFRDVGYEIVDTIIEAKEQSETEKGLTFKQKKYDKNSFIQEIIKLDNDKFRSIVQQVHFKEDIKSRPLYILGCVLTAADDPKAKCTTEQLEQFMKNGG